MYPGLASDYYGIKVTFKRAPISGVPIKEFVFSRENLLVMLAQSFSSLYELVMPTLNFHEPALFPVKAVVPVEYLDAAQLPRQGKHKAGVTPKFIMDIGGRKISIYIPSDKYCYDLGELPLYAARANIPSASRLRGTESFVITEDGKFNDVLDNPDAAGGNRIYTQKGKERFSYIDFYLALKQHYGADLNSPRIVSECRQVLSGGLLSSGESPVLPSMLASMFVSEVSRNRACLVTALMLFDLMEARISAPSASGKDGFYCFENVLWHPELYAVIGRVKRKDPKLKALGALGGFHPMAHIGSWSDEFAKDGPYQRNSQLTHSHVKSVAIIIDWFCHLQTNEMSISKLNSEQYYRELSQYETNFESRVRIPGAQSWESAMLALTSRLHPYVKKRLTSFERMLPLPKYIHLSDQQYHQVPLSKLTAVALEATRAVARSRVNYTNLAEDFRRKSVLRELNYMADSREAEILKQHRALFLDNYEAADFNPVLNEELKQKIDDISKSDETCIAFIRTLDPSIDHSKWRYYKKDGEDNKTAITCLINMENLKDPYSLSLVNMILNIDADEKKIIYRIIFSSRYFFEKFYKGYTSPGNFIKKLFRVSSFGSDLVDILFDKENDWLLNKLHGSDLLDLCQSSLYLFKALMLDYPLLFRKILKEGGRFLDIKTLLDFLQDNSGLACGQSDLERVLGLEYGERINKIIKGFLSEIAGLSFGKTQSGDRPLSEMCAATVWSSRASEGEASSPGAVTADSIEEVTEESEGDDDALAMVASVEKAVAP